MENWELTDQKPRFFGSVKNKHKQIHVHKFANGRMNSMKSAQWQILITM